MPYTIQKRNNGSRPWKIIKKTSGEVVGSSASRQDAEASMKARYANEHTKFSDADLHSFAEQYKCSYVDAFRMFDMSNSTGIDDSCIEESTDEVDTGNVQIITLPSGKRIAVLEIDTDNEDTSSVDDSSLAEFAAGDEGTWITVNGRHILLKDGENSGMEVPKGGTKSEDVSGSFKGEKSLDEQIKKREHYAKTSDSAEERRMHESDANNLKKIKVAMKQGNTTEAKSIVKNLDSAVMDELPADVRNLYWE